MKASDLFLRCLEAQGVEYIFGVPGEENADMMISLLDSNIKFITCRHEQSASFMADMYGRLTGKPGVCLATLGPGATNLLTGVANANMDNSPLVAIIGQASTKRLHKESHQNMDAVDMFKPVTKWATTIRDASVIPEVVYKAFKLSEMSKPGAVLIELPEDIAKENAEYAPIKSTHSQFSKGVSSTNIDRALELLEHAKSPVLLIGNGATQESCDDVIAEFVKKTNIYGANTFMGKGVLSDRNDHSLFCVGLGMKDIAVEAFDHSDLVICIGYGMVEWHPDLWNNGQRKHIIHIDIAPAEVDKNYIPDVEIVGSIKQILSFMNSKLTDAHVKEKDQFAHLRKAVYEDVHAYDKDDSCPVKPQRILHEVRKVMRDDDVLISDVGAHKMWVARHYPTFKSKSCFIHNGFCSMGGAMPGAVTVKKVDPSKNVVAICGDGGFIMSIQALSSAIEEKVPAVIMIWEDHHYGLIKWKQEAAFRKSSHTEFVNPDFVKLAEAYGAHGVKIKSPDEIGPALEAAFKEKEMPTIIIVPVDYSENMKLTEHLGEVLSH